MAAESAALATAIDRHLYCRLLVQSLLYGEPNFNSNWRAELSIPGVVVTDAGSLYDHLHKTGSVPKERQVLIDLLTVRDLVEEKVVDLRWVPTTHMLADILTKKMKVNPIQRALFEDNKFMLAPTEEDAATE